jgi:hypothetical protein
MRPQGNLLIPRRRPKHQSADEKAPPAVLSYIQKNDFTAVLLDLTSRKHMWRPPTQAFLRKLDNRRFYHNRALAFGTIISRRGYRNQISYPPDQMKQCVLISSTGHWTGLKIPH